MKNQRGLALSELIFWGILIAAIAILAIKVTPDVIDFYKIRKDVISTAANSAGKTVPEIRNIYSKYAEVDHVSTVLPADLDITKEGNQVVISFAYEQRIPLFANVSLLIDFQGSSSGHD